MRSHERGPDLERERGGEQSGGQLHDPVGHDEAGQKGARTGSEEGRLGGHESHHPHGQDEEQQRNHPKGHSCKGGAEDQSACVVHENIQDCQPG